VAGVQDLKERAGLDREHARQEMRGTEVRHTLSSSVYLTA
jgi:hypothetical protein